LLRFFVFSKDIADTACGELDKAVTTADDKSNTTARASFAGLALFGMLNVFGCSGILTKLPIKPLFI
jgi:hypothetical protein